MAHSEASRKLSTRQVARGWLPQLPLVTTTCHTSPLLVHFYTQHHGCEAGIDLKAGAVSLKQSISLIYPLILPKLFITTYFNIPVMQIQAAPLRGERLFFFLFLLI